ncbi:hypothetical protein SADUNF_Sadunf13G0122100 [Salix dunnii]|uniref:Uncharacterized protein n=1 Tax=Salix dunnii TaxID=1413687 RepID=A0A835JJP1_9ROSI|nr:hypothetical protein SADUNF_Sadunf13G0122100 [Salix dunnii]
MLTSSSKLPQKSLKLKQHDKKGSSERVTRDVSMAKLSTEDYHVGASVAVPFTWESQPGTPKIRFRENPLPPLTPPPSYFYNTPERPTKKLSKSSLLNSIFPKRSASKTNLPASPASSSSSSSSSSRLSSSWSATYSVPSSPMKFSKSRGGYNGISNPRQYFDTRKMMPNRDDQDHENKCDEYPVSTLCCGGNGRGASAKSRGCYASMIKVLLRDA